MRSKEIYGRKINRKLSHLSGIILLTGLLFGIANVALAYPYVLESMREVEADYRAKFGKQKV